MPVWFNYCPLAPLRDEYVDDDTRVICRAHVSITASGNYEVSLIGDQTSIELIRVATLDSDGNLTALQSETVGKLVDHMLTVLRFTYNDQVDALRFGENMISIGTHDVDGTPSMRVRISDVLGKVAPINSDNIRNVFIQSLPTRHLMKLMSDAQNHLLPLQYKFLSLYKVFELEFRHKRKWIGLNECLAAVEHDYRAIKLSALSLPNLIHDLRDKCAHIKIGSDDKLGIVGLDGPDAKTVEAVTPLLRTALLAHLAVKYPQFTIVQGPPGADQGAGASDVR